MPDHVPDYVRVAQTIRDRIASGFYKPGEALPTKRQLAVEFGVGTSSIDTAMVLLRAEGLVRGHQGKAVYVAEGGTPSE